MSADQPLMIRKGYADTPHGQLHYRTAGQGPALILMHQAAQESAEFGAVISYLSTSYRVFAPDLPGHGRSDIPDREYQVADYVQSVLDFMDAVAISSAALVGVHGGAAISIGVAAARPAAIDRLILYGSSLLSPEEVDRFSRMPMSRDLPLTADGSFLIKTWETYRKMAAPETGLDIVFKPFLIGLTARQAPWDAHHPIFRWDKKPYLPRIQCPTLLIKGPLDRFLGRQEEMAALIPDCRLATLENGGVFACYEYPEQFAELILSFLVTIH